MTGQLRVSAVLLDMDGTLLDTEKVYFDNLVAALNASGYTDDIIPLCHAMVGLPGAECEAMLHERYGANFLLTEVNKAFIAKRDEIFEAGLPLKRGTIELLDALHAIECPTAIVTSSSRGRRCASDTCGSPRPFRDVPDLDDVKRGSRAPIYLLAASQLRVEPEVCVAVRIPTMA